MTKAIILGTILGIWYLLMKSTGSSLAGTEMLWALSVIICAIYLTASGIINAIKENK